MSIAELCVEHKAILLANVVRCLLSPVRLSSVCRLSVCNAHAPYSGGCNLRQYFYGIWYAGHPLTYKKNFTEIVPGEPLRWGVYTTGVAKYSDFEPIEGYISRK